MPRISTNIQPQLRNASALEFIGSPRRNHSNVRPPPLVRSDRFEVNPSSKTTAVTTSAPVQVQQQTTEATDIPKPGFWYNAKQAFWSNIVAMAFKSAKILPISKPRNERLEMVRFNEAVPEINIDQMFVTTDVPEAEKSRSKQMLYAAIRWLSSNVSIHSDNLPPISSNFEAMMKEAYPAKYEALLPAPVIPPEIKARPDDIVGTMALSGPFASYVQKVEGQENLYKIDLEKYSGLKVHDGLAPLGGTVYMNYSPSEKRMNTSHIRYEGKNYMKDCPEWNRVQKIALCTLSTDATVIRHLSDTHILVAGTYAGVTTNNLNAKHPLRALLHPHLHQTLSTNNYKVANLIKTNESVFPKIFSFDKDQTQQLMNNSAKSFDITKMDPQRDAQNRGFGKDTKVDYPYLDNATKLWSVTEDYVKSYLDAYYPTEEALNSDSEIHYWYNDLNKYIPNGVRQYAPEVTKENIAKLATLLIHTAAVEHENVGNITWNYTNLHQYIPSIVPADGSNPPVDIFQRYINTSILTFIPLNQLMDNFSHIALDQKGVACMKQYRENLNELQTEMEKKPFSYSALYPKALEGSVST